MSVGGGGHHPRIAPSELDLDASMRPLRRGARLMRRVGSKWTQVGRFGSIAEAQQALDEQVGEGHGDAREYLVVVPSSRFHTITKVVLIAALSAGIALVVSFIVQ